MEFWKTEYFISTGGCFTQKMFANNQEHKQTHSYNNKLMHKIICICVELMPKERKRLSIASEIS